MPLLSLKLSSYVFDLSCCLTFLCIWPLHRHTEREERKKITVSYDNYLQILVNRAFSVYALLQFPIRCAENYQNSGFVLFMVHL